MKIKLQSFILVVLVLNSLFLLAQNQAQTSQPMSLEDCIEYALKNNIQIQQSELTSEISELTLTQNEATLLPTLNGSANHTYNYGRTIDRFTNQFATKQVLSQNFGVSSSFTLFNGMQTLNTIKQSRYNYLASRYDIEKMKNDVALNVASAYLQVLYALEGLNNARNQFSITQTQVERTQKLVDAGAASKGSLLDIRAQLAAEELLQTNAQNQLDIAYLSLAQLLNFTTADGLSIVKPDVIVADDMLAANSVTDIFNTAVSSLPEMKSAEFKLKGYEKALDVAWGGLSPKLSLNAAYGTGYSGLSKQVTALPQLTGFTPNGTFTSAGDTVFAPTFSSAQTETVPFFDQYKTNVNKSVGFQLTVPLFNQLQTKTAISKARVQKMNAELTAESTKLQIQKNVQQAYADANAGFKKYHSTRKALEAMAESFSYTQEKFNLGMVNANDFNTAKNKLTKAESDLLQAKYEYVFKIKVLDFYQGKPLKL